MKRYVEVRLDPRQRRSVVAQLQRRCRCGPKSHHGRLFSRHALFIEASEIAVGQSLYHVRDAAEEIGITCRTETVFHMPSISSALEAIQFENETDAAAFKVVFL